MKRTSIAALAVAALALAGTQAAFADDNNQGNAKGKVTQQLVEVNGTIKSLAAPTITVTIKNASMSDKTRAIAQAMLRAGVVTFGTDTNTAIKRGTANTFASLAVGDKVELRAKCTLAPLTCLATRVIAAPVVTPTPKPAPLHLGFTLDGVIATNTGAQFGVIVVRAGDGDDNPLKPKSILGTTFNVLADTSTAVYTGTTLNGTGTAAVLALGTMKPVMVSGTCASTLPIVCTAKRVTVIVPTA